MRLLESFFRCQTHNPYIPPVELIFEKTTAGTFSYTIPSNARNVMIEIGGGRGQGLYLSQHLVGSGGRGGRVNILDDVVGSLAGKVITGTVAANATGSTGIGGSGAPAGGNGTHTTPGGSSTYGGGGGGATEIIVDGTTYQASGGGGATLNDYYGGWYSALGGDGGGANGGYRGTSQQVTSGVNGFDARDTFLNTAGFGYVRVYINYQSETLFEKITPGNFQYTIPNTVSNVIIELAAGNGGSGGIGGYSNGDNAMPGGGRGGVKILGLTNVNGMSLSGVIGQSVNLGQAPNIGGTPDGGNGGYGSISSPRSEVYGGGGGGSSTFTMNAITYSVSGGAGGAAKNGNVGWRQGGAGGGASGGQPVTNAAGGNATDGDQLNAQDYGYIKVTKV